MNFVILRSEGRMSADNIVLDLDSTSWISDSGIELAILRGDTGVGLVERNDRPRVLEQMSDPAPVFKGPIDDWIAAAATLSSPLTLAQAKQVKIGFVDALYNWKRTRPFPYGGYLYDGSDEAIKYMGALMVSASSGQTSLTGIIATLNANIQAYNRSADAVDSWSPHMQTNWSTIQMYHHSSLHWNVYITFNVGHGHTGQQWLGKIYNSIGTYSTPPSHSGFENMTVIGVSLPSHVPWHPIDAPAAVDITVNDFRNMLSGIVSRRVNLDIERGRKHAEIQALGSIGDVIDYDVTAWW